MCHGCCHFSKPNSKPHNPKTLKPTKARAAYASGATACAQAQLERRGDPTWLPTRVDPDGVPHWVAGAAAGSQAPTCSRVIARPGPQKHMRGWGLAYRAEAPSIVYPM